jgi:OOP family OmpA-OmpF porin
MLQPTKWWIGLPVLAGIVYLATVTLTGRVETDLTNRAAQRLALEKGAIDGGAVVAAGRDVAISGVVLSPSGRDRTLLAIGELDGVRAALDQTRPVAAVHPYVLKIERKGLLLTLNGNVPPNGERGKLRGELNPLGLGIVDHTSYATGAPAAFVELAAFAARRLAEMDPGVATLTDDALSIKGDALPGVDLEKLIADAKSPPAGARTGEIAVNPPRVSPYVWSAARKGEMIALEGFVPSGEARSWVVAKAGAIAAGAAVSDAMHIGSGAPSGDFLGAVDVALTQLGKLASGKVSLSDAGVSVEGEGKANILAATIEAEAKAGLPQGFALAKIAVLDGAATPFAFAATLKDGTLALNGFIPDAASRDEIRALAQKGAPGLALTDALTVSGGAPKNFTQAVAAGIQALERLFSGVLTFSDNAVSLVGEAPFEDAVADIDRRLTSALPQGFAVTVRLTARSLGAPLEPGERQKAINDVLAKTPLLFGDGPGAALQNSATSALDALAALMLRSSGGAFEIIGHVDGPGIEEVNRSLAKRKAQAVIDRLVALGVDPASLAPVGVAAQTQGQAAIGVVAK